MFAFIPRTEVTIRIALIAAILFNASSYTAAYANSSIAQRGINSNPNPNHYGNTGHRTGHNPIHNRNSHATTNLNIL